MKTITLITMLLVTCVSNAQLNLEFESMLDQKIVGHPAEKILAYTDRNPVTGGINTSQNTVKIVEFAGCEYWGATIINGLPQTISLLDGRYFSVDFLSPKARGMITLKLKNGVEKDFVYSGQANTWRRAVFSFTDTPKATSSEKLDIFFDVRDHRNSKKLGSKNRSEEIYWIDNISQSRKRIRKK